MSDLEQQIQNRLSQVEDADLEGAKELIDAHIDEATGGAFSLHVQFRNSKDAPSLVPQIDVNLHL